MLNVFKMLHFYGMKEMKRIFILKEIGFGCFRVENMVIIKASRR